MGFGMRSGFQVSGSFGSRQEEAQRLGRVLRPKGDGRAAHFYSIVTRDTVDSCMPISSAKLAPINMPKR